MPNTHSRKATIQQKFINYELHNVGRTLKSPDIIELNYIVQLSVFNKKIHESSLAQVNQTLFEHFNNVELEHTSLSITENDVLFCYDAHKY